MMAKRRWWWLLVALVPLLYLPLRAQETQPTGPATAPATPAPAAAEPAPTPAEAAPEPKPTEEQVSADNNLSFPVDI
jgi:hypothetical protein